MTSALDKVLLAAGVKPAEPAPDPAANATETEGLVGLALSVGARTGLTAEDISYLVLAADDSDSKKDDSSGGDDYDCTKDPYYKKLIAKGVNPKMAAAICKKKHAAAGKGGDDKGDDSGDGKKPNPFAKKGDK